MPQRVTEAEYDVDRAVEFDRQVQTLVDKGYPDLTGRAVAAFVALLSPLRDAVADLAPPERDDRIPFVLVVTGPAREQAFARVDLRGRTGFTTMEPDDLARFVPTAEVEVPAATAYLLADIDTGQDTLDVPPDDAMPTILAAGRLPLTLDEGIAVVTHNPDLLTSGNRFSMLGSRCGDRRVTAIWVSQHRPRLGWCWAGAPHTWLGSASCGSRAG
jgi:hypothetical protein